MVKVFVSPWCPWCKEVTEAIVFNLLMGVNIEVLDPFSVDTRLGIFRHPEIQTEPSVFVTKDRTYFKSFLTKGHMRYLLKFCDMPLKKLMKLEKEFD